jgi:hypothetical protein
MYKENARRRKVEREIERAFEAALPFIGIIAGIILFYSII